MIRISRVAQKKGFEVPETLSKNKLSSRKEICAFTNQK